MATQNLVQKLDSDTVAVMSRRVSETFVANGVIAAGSPVAFDVTVADEEVTLKVVAAGADGPSFGCALDSAAAAGDLVRVVISGICEATVIEGDTDAVSAGDMLVADGAGYRLMIASDLEAHARAVDAVSAASATATIIVRRVF